MAVAARLILLFLLSPLFFLIAELFTPINDHFRHLFTHLVGTYAMNTLWLVLFTGLGTSVVGFSVAWLFAAYDFPFKRTLRWWLVLPLAIPPYIGAYAYQGFLDYTGPLQRLLRVVEIGVTPGLLNIRHIPGAVWVYTLFLFPYVSLTVGGFLSRQPASLFEAARGLGVPGRRIATRLALPLSRPALVGGVSLVLMETLNDYGVVTYFGIPTFTTAIFRTWFGRGDLATSVKLAGMLMVVVVGLLVFEKMGRGGARVTAGARQSRSMEVRSLSGGPLIAAYVFIGLLLLFSLLLPLGQLVYWAFLGYGNVSLPGLLGTLFNTLLWSALAAGIILLFSVISADELRHQTDRVRGVWSQLLTLGYAVPGAVIAIGILSLSLAVDRLLSPVLMGEAGHLVLTMTPLVLLSAYVIRFMALGFNATQAGFERIGSHYHEAARLLGRTRLGALAEADLPLLKSSLSGAFLMVLIDLMKELPLTLLLRPFNFDTLATRVYAYAGDEMLAESALPSLMILAIGGMAIYWMMGRKKKGDAR